MKLPGTVPPKVQNVYFTPAAISRSTSRTSSFTMTLAGAWRPVGGGTRGGLVSTAFTGSPCGGPKSPEREPPVSAAVAAVGVEFWLQAASSAAARTTNHLFIEDTPGPKAGWNFAAMRLPLTLIQVRRGVDKQWGLGGPRLHTGWPV